MALRGVGEFEADLAALAADPALADLIRPGAALLVADATGETLVWASPVAREALRIDADGRIDAASPAAARIQALARELSPGDPVRFEAIRFGTEPAAAASACAVGKVLLPSGPALLVAAVGLTKETGTGGRGASLSPRLDDKGEARRPKRPRPPARARTGARPPERGVMPGERQRGCIRFVWQADADGRFVHVSGGLAEAVGAAAADIMGRTWDEIVGRLVDDPSATVSGRFARQETWSGCTVLWHVGEGRTVPVELAGLATFGPGRRLSGFRGFGLVKNAPAVVDPEAPGPELERSAPTAPASALPAASSSAEAHSPARDRGSARALASLSPAERQAFRDIARALGTRPPDEGPHREGKAAHPPDLRPVPRQAVVQVTPAKTEAVSEDGAARLLDSLRVAMVVHRDGEVLFANRGLLDLLAYPMVQELVRQSRSSISRQGSEDAAPARHGTNRPVTIPGRRGQAIRAELEETTMEWQGRSADVTIVRELGDERTFRGDRTLEAEVQARETRLRELTSILDTATDGVVILDEAGRILSLNRSAEAVFGYDQSEVAGQSFTRLFAPEAAQVALEYLNGLRSNGVESLLNDGREVLGLVRQGGTIPLSMTLGRLGDGPARTFCAVLRDNTGAKKAERDLMAAKHAAEEASARKSELLAKISHEIRTPLNAMVGFAEVMLEERFGSIGNERYRDYLKDIRASGVHVVSLVDDLLDLARAEAGEMALAFTELDLNAVVGACVASLQGSAAREQIVVRTSFAARLPRILADERSTRQIAATVVANAIRFTQAGGQVIVSTALTDLGEVAFRVRDTGVGMTEEQLEQALEPFRQVAAARRGGGSGLGLPLTRALVQANRGLLQITSARDEGTLVEVLFPPTRVLAEEPRSRNGPEGPP